jgi:hypothetical protein
MRYNYNGIQACVTVLKLDNKFDMQEEYSYLFEHMPIRSIHFKCYDRPLREMLK